MGSRALLGKRAAARTGPGVWLGTIWSAALVRSRFLQFATIRVCEARLHTRASTFLEPARGGSSFARNILAIDRTHDSAVSFDHERAGPWFCAGFNSDR